MAPDRALVDEPVMVSATNVPARQVLEQIGTLLHFTWVRSGDEHVASYVAPDNVVQAPEGRSLEEMLLAGELDAVVGAAIDHPDVVPLLDRSAAWGERRIFPVNHVVVVRDQLVEEHSGLATAVFEAFVTAKKAYVEQLRAGLDATRQDRTLRAVMAATGVDPLPYGVEPNRAVLEELIDHAVAQGILTAPMRLEDAFVPETRDLVG